MSSRHNNSGNELKPTRKANEHSFSLIIFLKTCRHKNSNFLYIIKFRTLEMLIIVEIYFKGDNLLRTEKVYH